jgi:hypothetical protein
MSSSLLPTMAFLIAFSLRVIDPLLIHDSVFWDIGYAKGGHIL